MGRTMENSTGSISNPSGKRPIGRVLLDTAAESVVSVVLFCLNFLGWTVRWTLAATFFIAIMVVAAYFVFNEAVKGGGFEEVPDVVGLPVTRAAFVLAEVGLEVGQQRQVVSDHFPEYHVILQRPAAHKVVRSGRKINLTISAGKQIEPAPNLVGKDLRYAINLLEGTRLLAGSLARIPHRTPKNLVLAQDPAAGLDVPVGGEIHLLLSDGPRVRAKLMPELANMQIRRAIDTLGSLGLEVVIYKVDRPWAEYDVVLEQRPEAGILLHDEQVVSIDVRPLPTTRLPDAWRKVSVVYTVPDVSFRPQIRADVVGLDGARRTVFPAERLYVDGAPPRFEPGTTITIPISFLKQATLEFYADDMLDRSYYYEGDADPVITEFGTSQPAETEGNALDSSVPNGVRIESVRVPAIVRRLSPNP